MERLYCDYCGELIQKDNGESRIIYAGSSCGPQFVISSETSKGLFELQDEMLSYGSCECLHSCSSDCTVFLLTFFNLFGVEKFLRVLDKQRESNDDYSDTATYCNEFVKADNGKEEEPDDENDEDKEDWEKQIERDGGRIPIRSIPNWKEAIIG